jgi:hypothetical protein
VNTVRWPQSATNPKWGYQPFGGIGWLRWVDGPANQPKMQFYRGDKDTEINHGSPPAAPAPTGPDEFGALQHSLDFGPANVVPGGTYWMRMRCETQPDTAEGEGVTLYSWKIWDDGETEPVDWSWTPFPQISAEALRRGGVALLAHHVDATFGDVVITDLTGGPSPVPAPVAGRIVLFQNQPNPFNPLTVIRMDVPREATAHLAVYDIQGRLVRNLFRGNLPAGLREFRWDGRDDTGRDAAGGIYLFRLDAEGRSETRKMTLVR